MITLFRRLRYNLMNQHKSSRYLKYAIGEIILVVIGILIALQINNWNEDRKALKAEIKLLSALNNEFKLNRNVLKTDIADLDKTINALSTTLKLMSKNLEISAIDSKLDSILLVCITNYQWEATDFALKELENSSKLSDLQNEDLKPMIYDWSRHLKQIEKNSEESYKSFDFLLDYIKRHGSLRQLDRYQQYLPEGASILRKDNLNLLTDPEFENAVDDFLVYTRQLQESYEQAIVKLDLIISKTETLKTL